MADIREMVDRVIATSAVIVLSPLLVAIALLQKATSKGPILFMAAMLGKRGRVFQIKKFRSMEIGAAQILSDDDKTVVLKDDPRLTLLGPYIRVGFDELPQLLNIMFGEMAFVGPRPDPSWVLPRYTPLIRERLEVRPGITGLSQVLDGRNQRQAVIYYLDAYYVRHRSWAMDLKILAMTMPYVLGWKTPGRIMLNRILAQAGTGEVNEYELLPANETTQLNHEARDQPSLILEDGCSIRGEKP